MNIVTDSRSTALAIIFSTNCLPLSRNVTEDHCNGVTRAGLSAFATRQELASYTEYNCEGIDTLLESVATLRVCNAHSIDITVAAGVVAKSAFVEFLLPLCLVTPLFGMCYRPRSSECTFPGIIPSSRHTCTSCLCCYKLVSRSCRVKRRGGCQSTEQ